MFRFRAVETETNKICEIGYNILALLFVRVLKGCNICFIICMNDLVKFVQYTQLQMPKTREERPKICCNRLNLLTTMIVHVTYPLNQTIK